MKPTARCQPIFSLYRNLLERRKLHISLYFLVLLFTASLQLPIPLLLSRLIDSLSQSGTGNSFWILIAGITGLSLLNIVVSVLAKIYSAKLNRNFLVEIRLRAFEALQTAPTQFRRQFESSDLQSRLTSDVGVLNHFLPTGVANALRNVCFVLVFGAMLIASSPLIVTYVAGFLPLVVVVFKLSSEKLARLSNSARTECANANATMLESLQSLRESRMTGSDHFHRVRLKDALDSSEEKLVQARLHAALMTGMIGIIPVLVTAMIWWIGSQKVLAESMTVGQLVSFMLMLSMLYRPISELFDAASGYVYESAAFRRIAEICGAEKSGTPASGRNSHTALCSKVRVGLCIELRGLVFSYRDTKIIERVSDTISAGTCTAIVGPNGAGKTTLVSMIAGLVQADAGQVLINKQPISELPPDTLARCFGYVPQEIFIMGDSLRANITMGRDISDCQILKTISELDWTDFLNDWSLGLDTAIQESGRNLSGGQRQKIALLRALCNQPNILIMDEPENNLDVSSTEKLVRYIEHLKQRCTVVLVSHGDAFENVVDQKLGLWPMTERAIVF